MANEKKDEGFGGHIGEDRKLKDEPDPKDSGSNGLPPPPQSRTRTDDAAVDSLAGLFW